MRSRLAIVTACAQALQIVHAVRSAIAKGCNVVSVRAGFGSTKRQANHAQRITGQDHSAQSLPFRAIVGPGTAALTTLALTFGITLALR